MHIVSAIGLIPDDLTDSIKPLFNHYMHNTGMHPNL